MSCHYFPEEILVEILVRLPAKSICRLTVVCRSWHSLITSPSFISRHLHHALKSIENHQQDTAHKTLLLGGVNSNCCVFLGDRNERLNFPFDGCLRIVGSSNGLLCLASAFPDPLPLRDPDEVTDDDVQKVILWNPSTGRSVFLLPRPTIGRAFHVVFGFGKSSRDGEDYKVVRIAYLANLYVNSSSPEVEVEVEVYSLKTRAWKKAVQPDVKGRIMPSCKSQVLVNGRLHWLASRRRPGHSLPQSLILAFDLIDEVFIEIMVPDEFSSGNRVKLCYNLSEECVTAIETRGTARGMACCIWMMKEYGVVESWTITYSFDLVHGMMNVVAVLGDGEVLVAKGNNDLVSYDIKTGTIKDAGLSGPAALFDVHRHVESLVSLRPQRIKRAVEK